MHMMYNFPFKPFYVYSSVVGRLDYCAVNLQKFFISLFFFCVCEAYWIFPNQKLSPGHQSESPEF